MIVAESTPPPASVSRRSPNVPTSQMMDEDALKHRVGATRCGHYKVDVNHVVQHYLTDRVFLVTQVEDFWGGSRDVGGNAIEVVELDRQTGMPLELHEDESEEKESNDDWPRTTEDVYPFYDGFECSNQTTLNRWLSVEGPTTVPEPCYNEFGSEDASFCEVAHRDSARPCRLHFAELRCHRSAVTSTSTRPTSRGTGTKMDATGTSTLALTEGCTSATPCVAAACTTSPKDESFGGGYGCGYGPAIWSSTCTDWRTHPSTWTDSTAKCASLWSGASECAAPGLDGGQRESPCKRLHQKAREDEDVLVSGRMAPRHNSTATREA